jgi:hypothetical protein
VGFYGICAVSRRDPIPRSFSEDWKESCLAESEKSNLLAEEANFRAFRANWIALIAAAIAIPTAIIAIVALMKIST